MSKYMFFGSGNHLLILESTTTAGPVTHSVSLIDFGTSKPTERHILTATASSTAVNPPNIHFSQGSGDAFFIFAPTGSLNEAMGLAIYRSDNGQILCAGPSPHTIAIQLVGEATATQLQIKDGGTVLAACPLPLGQLTVSPSSQKFPNVAVGGCGPGFVTKQFTLKNTGSDCLTINAIADAAPFSVVSASPAVGSSLSPGEAMTVDVRFAPTAVGSSTKDLTVTRTPPRGDDRLAVQGVGVAPSTSIGISVPLLSFGSVPVGTTTSQTVTISNTGQTPVVVSVLAPASGSPFSWTGLDEVTIPCGGTPLSVPVQFTPADENPQTTSLTITSHPPDSATVSTRSVPLSGRGCVPNAEIVVPPAPFPSFGEVQQGFRTVRFITVRNLGDGPLAFSARITGADAALYSLVDPAGSITGGSATRAYTVDPVTSCGPGPTGPGHTVVAVAFFANTAPKTTSAELVIEGHNATNPVPASWTFPLTAEIIPGIALDAAVVLDRSGSMAELLGTRRKVDACIQAGRLLVQLLRPDVEDRIALVKFDDVVDVLQAMTDVTSANQATISNQINGSELAPRGTTAIAGGVMVAADQFIPRAVVPPQLTKAMLVLTDGKDNTAYQPPGSTTWYTVLGGPAMKPGGGQVDTVPMPMPAGIKVYGIGLGTGPDIDAHALNQLSTATGAYYGVVADLTGPDYFNLEKYFTQVFMDWVGMPPIMDPVYTITPGSKQTIEFDVLRGDVSALIVINDKDGGQLPFYAVSPRGELVEPASIPPGYQLRAGATGTARFVEFRMPLAEPDRYAGRWSVVVEHPGRACFGTPGQGHDARHGFVTSRCRPRRQPLDYGIAIGVGSNFRMEPYVTPGPVRVGDPILLTATVSEAGLPVTGCSVTVQAKSPSGTIRDFKLYDDGAHLDADPDDGEYAWQFLQTAEEGSYEFRFRAEGTSRDGEPVTREALRAKYVEGRISSDPCCRFVSSGSHRE